MIMSNRYQTSESGYEHIDYGSDYTFIYPDVYDHGFVFIDEDGVEVDDTDEEIENNDVVVPSVYIPFVECPGIEEIGVA